MCNFAVFYFLGGSTQILLWVVILQPSRKRELHDVQAASRHLTSRILNHRYAREKKFLKIHRSSRTDLACPEVALPGVQRNPQIGYVPDGSFYEVRTIPHQGKGEEQGEEQGKGE